MVGFYCMCNKYMYTMSEGAWKSVTSHVSQDTAATVRQAGLHSLTTNLDYLTLSACSIYNVAQHTSIMYIFIV